MSGRAVVALEPDDLGAAGEVRLESENVVHLCTAPAVNRLVVVADAANTAVALSKQAQPEILGDVRVLIFVDQHIEEALLVFFEHVLMLLEQPQILEKQIAEIGSVQLLKPTLIGSVKIARLAIGEGEALAFRHALGPQAAVLPAVDHRGE